MLDEPLKPWPTQPWPHSSDLGTHGGNPLEELAGRAKPVQDAWGLTSYGHRTLHVGALDEMWLMARPQRSLMVLGPPRDTGKTTGVLVPTVLVADHLGYRLGQGGRHGRDHGGGGRRDDRQLLLS